jgi:hypothetical protein
MRPTPIRLLVALAIVAGSLGWAIVVLVHALAGRVVVVPWLAAGAMWLVAGALLSWTLSVRPRLQRQPGARPIAPIVAARSAALAIAASRIGALVAGFYAGVVIGLIPLFGTVSGAQSLWAALATCVGSAALAAVALWLEHICRLPAGPGGDDRLAP